MADLRKEVTALYQSYMQKSDERVYINYKKVLRKYKNMCIKAKDRHRKRTHKIIPDESKMAKHIKSLSEQICPQIGSVIKPDGRNSLVGKGTQGIIMNSQFPQNIEPKLTSYQNHITIFRKDLHYFFKTWLSLDKIKLALNSFKDKKTPGPDGMKPIIFKHFPESILKLLQLIYKAVIKLHFTPTIWKDAKVIFIPKPGKIDYSTPKSFRPISLSNLKS